MAGLSSDTQYELMCWKIGFTFYEYALLISDYSGERSRPLLGFVVVVVVVVLLAVLIN